VSCSVLLRRLCLVPRREFVEYYGGSMSRLGGRENPEPGVAEHGVCGFQYEFYPPRHGVADDMVGIRRGISGRGLTHVGNARLREHHDSHRQQRREHKP